MIIKLDKKTKYKPIWDCPGYNGRDISRLVCVHVVILIAFQKLQRWYVCWGANMTHFLVISIHKANINYVNDYEGCPCFLMNHLVHLDYILLMSHISNWSYQAVQIQQKSSNIIARRSSSIGAINFTTQEFNGLMQLRRFYFDIQLRAFIGVETAALTFRTKQYSTSYSSHIC